MLPVDPARFALFVGMMAVFAITPGPAVLFSIATGVRAGPRAALLGAAGINLGNLVWLIAAALGLGALIAAFPDYVRLLAIAGAIYVAWLGLKPLISAWRGQTALAAARGSTEADAFRDGLLVQMSNPKAVIFYTAILPPFLDPARPALAQLALYGVAIIACDVISMAGYGLMGGALARSLERPPLRRAFAVVVGVLLIAAAALILLRR